MTGLKTFVGIALIVGGMTAVTVGQDLAARPRGSHDDNGAVGRWNKDKGDDDRRKKDKGDDDRRKKDDKGLERGRPRGAPEIDGTSAVGALALLSGLLLDFRGDRRV